VVIEQGAAAVERRNTFENVEHPVIWAEPALPARKPGQ
jgi:hypothetical protein